MTITHYEEHLTLEDKQNFIKIALIRGNKTFFDFLKQRFSDVFYTKYCSPETILAAARGGNPHLLKEVIEWAFALDKDLFIKSAQKISPGEKNSLSEEKLKEAYKFIWEEYVHPKQTSELMRHSFKSAIDSLSGECVSVIIETLKTVKPYNEGWRDYKRESYSASLDDKELLDYLNYAIEQNAVEPVHAILKQRRHLPRQLSLTSLAINRTDVRILELLKDNGMIFSKEAEDILTSKRTQSWLSLKTVLDLLVRYIAEVFGEKQWHICPSEDIPETKHLVDVIGEDFKFESSDEVSSGGTDCDEAPTEYDDNMPQELRFGFEFFESDTKLDDRKEQGMVPPNQVSAPI